MNEALFVVSKIKLWYSKGRPFKEVAILYRRNSQSRIFENVMKQCSLPCKIYGGFAFYKRKEILDVFAHLNLVLRHSNDFAFIRCVKRVKGLSLIHI